MISVIFDILCIVMLTAFMLKGGKFDDIIAWIIDVVLTIGIITDVYHGDVYRIIIDTILIIEMILIQSEVIDKWKKNSK